MNTSLLSASVALITTVMALLSGCERDVDYLPAEVAERNEIVFSLEIFRKDTGRYPTANEGLEALLRDPGVQGWDGPYYSESKRGVLTQYSYGLTDKGTITLERRSGNSSPGEKERPK